jgi:hypothetical protein
MASLSREVRVTPVLNPDRVWDDHIAPILASDPSALRELARGAFGELVRNAVEHAQAAWIQFSFANTARDIDISVADDGVGLFAALQERLGALASRECAERIARLSNARSVNSPTARLALLARNFGTFTIASAGVALKFDRETNAWTVTETPDKKNGTAVSFCLRRPATGSAARSTARSSATAAR